MCKLVTNCIPEKQRRGEKQLTIDVCNMEETKRKTIQIDRKLATNHCFYLYAYYLANLLKCCFFVIELRLVHNTQQLRLVHNYVRVI